MPEDTDLPVANAVWRTTNPGFLMYTATGLCIRDKLAVLHRAGFAALTDAQLTLFQHIDAGGTRLTAIAARSGLTKQSMIELVNKATALGLVTRQPDPDDKRAKFVVPTADGLVLLEQLQAGIEAAERRMAHITGSGFLVEIEQELGPYAAGPAPAAGEADDPSERRTDIAACGRSTARILSLAARRFAVEGLAVAHRHGHLDVTEVLLALFRNLDLCGTRLTELAARARMTKQSMRELVDRAEALGYVGRTADPEDRRAKIIEFTPAGLAMLDGMRIGLAAAEEKLRAATSPGFVQHLGRGLADYIRIAQEADDRLSPP